MADFVAAKRPLWLERLAARWMARWSTTSALAASAVTVLLVGLLHERLATLIGHALDPLVFYLVPIGFAAWVAGRRAGVALAFLAATVNVAVAAWPAGGPVPPWILLAGFVLDLPVFLGTALAFALLRWHLERERHLSSTDPLTGIGNHRAFEDAVRREIARGGRRSAPLSLVYIDLDRFKELNDSRGHPQGDALLRIVGGALEASVRAVDSAARVGGDEFAVLLPDTGPEACRQVVTRIRDRLRSSARQAGFWNTFSVGAVTFERPPEDAASAVAAVDRAMYLVKRSGRDGVHHDVVPGGSPGSGLARRRPEDFDTFRPE
jgi:diguanylate cyclase (GGDEF)-like protein